MACGMIAMQLAGIDVESYDAYEIDKYAIKTATHNFPMIREHGDVFSADFTEYEGVDFLVGGSPCTYWSIAQTKNRETVASGMGWELFSQYVRALHEAKPKYFIYENNKSMSKQIRASIDDAFGFEAVLINSALVSAQNRQRLYWVGKRNADGTYSKVNVEQPEDRGILLKDVLDSAVAMREKAHAVIASAGRTTEREYFIKNQGNMAAEPICVAQRGRMYRGEPQHYEARDDGKTNTLTSVEKDNRVAEPIKCGEVGNGGQGNRIYSVNGKAVAQTAQSGGMGSNTGLYAVPYAIEFDDNGKAPTLTASAGMGGGHLLTQAICQVGAMPMPNGELSTSAGFRIYSTEAKGRYLCANGGGAGAKTGLYALPVDEPMKVPEATKKGYAEIQNGECIDLTQPNSKTRRGRAMTDKSNCCMTSCQYYQYCTKLVYATPCEWDENGNPTKAVSCADGKTYTVYKVENGQITIKDNQYPIKLVDGFYIIRKLTVRECMRLQTVPEWYDFSVVSNSQAYKMLGNGWTCEVIAHLIKACVDNDGQLEGQISIWEACYDHA